jgi:NADH-quinone oxidoreductase subunit J
MDGSTIIFYLLAAITLGSALLSVTTRHLFRAAVYLLFALIGIAGIYFWLSYEFIAAVQIVVYAGGISVLIIFSIFLTQQVGELLPVKPVQKQLFPLLAVFCALSLIMWEVLHYAFEVKQHPAPGPGVLEIGTNMLSTGNGGYALPFELVSVLLLAAMIGCIVIAMRSAQPDTIYIQQEKTD